jgi:beta-lactamase class D
LVRTRSLVERGRGYTLYAKTGNSGHVKDPVGVVGGLVERQGRPVAYFALQLRAAARERAFDLRFEIGRAILAEAGALPSESPPS